MDIIHSKEMGKDTVQISDGLNGKCSLEILGVLNRSHYNVASRTVAASLTCSRLLVSCPTANLLVA